MTPINTATSLSQSSSDSTPSSRPPYPRTQYNNMVTPRSHVMVEPSSILNSANTSMESPYAMHSTTWDPNVSQSPHVNSSGSYAETGKRVQVAPGHPLKSFTVPAPPPISAPGTPQTKHIVTVRPNSSPFKKQALVVNNAVPPTSRINVANPPPHTADEVQRLQPSHSTEELNQEMANLEGLMLTLNAITANQFEC